MSVIRKLARPLLAASFVAPPIAERLPVPEETGQLVKLNAGVQVVAGVLLAMGRLRRLAACALAVSLVPTSLAGHRFWEQDDPAQRAQQQIHFLKNVGLLGGLVLAAVDTEGAPSLGWRAKRAARRARRKVS
jgi:putative oxidoreductase